MSGPLQEDGWRIDGLMLCQVRSGGRVADRWINVVSGPLQEDGWRIDEVVLCQVRCRRTGGGSMK